MIETFERVDRQPAGIPAPRPLQRRDRLRRPRHAGRPARDRPAGRGDLRRLPGRAIRGRDPQDRLDGRPPDPDLSRSRSGSTGPRGSGPGWSPPSHFRQRAAGVTCCRLPPSPRRAKGGTIASTGSARGRRQVGRTPGPGRVRRRPRQPRRRPARPPPTASSRATAWSPRASSAARRRGRPGRGV